MYRVSVKSWINGNKKIFLFILSTLVIKVVLACLFSSDYLDMMFIPFVNTFLDNLGTGNWNVYQYYYENGLLCSFPYPPLMLAFVSVGGTLIKFSSVLGLSGILVEGLLFRFPSFLCDILLTFFLIRLYPEKAKYTAVFCYASPIVIYAVYMHGQLDIIPTALLFGSLFFLHRNGGHRYNLSAVFCAMAILTKTSVIAALPVIILFVFRRKDAIQAAKYLLIVCGLVVCGVIPFWSEGFIRRVLLNPEQNVVTKTILSMDTVELFIPVLAVVFVYLLALEIRTLSYELLISLSGIIFVLFVSVCQPYTGWFVWIVPYIAFFFINISNNRYCNMFIYMAFNVLYLIHFVFLRVSDYSILNFLGVSLNLEKLNNDKAASLVFTLMSAILLYFAWQMYRKGVSNNAFYRRGNTPFTIGIAGDSGAGKSSYMNMMEHILGEKQTLCIEGDGDHKWQRGEREWDYYTHLNPNANFLYRQAQNVIELREGASVRRRDYDHTTGKFSDVYKIRAKKFLFLCGLHSLYLPQMRENLDLKVYIDTDVNLRRHWKMMRDMAERGYKESDIDEQEKKRAEDAEKYIYPQKRYADLVIEYFKTNDTLSATLTFGAILNIDKIRKWLEKNEIRYDMDFSEDIRQQMITVYGDSMCNKDLNYDECLLQLLPNIDEITTRRLHGIGNINAFIALVSLMYIDEKMRCA